MQNNFSEDGPSAEEDLDCKERQVRGNGFTSACHATKELATKRHKKHKRLFI